MQMYGELDCLSFRIRIQLRSVFVQDSCRRSKVLVACNMTYPREALRRRIMLRDGEHSGYCGVFINIQSVPIDKFNKTHL